MKKVLIAVILIAVLALSGFILLKPNEENEALQQLKHYKKEDSDVKVRSIRELAW